MSARVRMILFGFQGTVEQAPNLSMELNFAADPRFFIGEFAAGFNYSPVMRSPLTNTDKNGEICSESVEFAQSFMKSLRVWEMVGDLGDIKSPLAL